MRKLFNVFAGIGVLFTTIELFLNLHHYDLCDSYGCKLARNNLTIPDNVVIGLGVSAFFILLFFSVLKKEKLIDGLLGVILSVEGVLVSYQLFRLKHLCYFCISVFFIFLLLAIIRLFEKRWLVLVGICSFVAILFVFSILKPYSSPRFVMDNYTLVYSPKCPHCERVKVYLKQIGFRIRKVKVSECISFLKLIGIKTVPVLFVRGKNQLKWFIGDKDIIEYVRDLKSKKAQPGFSFDRSIFNENEQKGFCSFSSPHCH